MTVQVAAFPSSIYPEIQRLIPDVGGGQSMNESPFAGSQSVVTYRGAERWRLEMSLSGLHGDDRADMMAFVTRLRVSHNVFLCINHTAPRRGALTGTPRAFGSLGGQYLNLYNLANNISSWARAGDFVAVNCQLRMVLDDAGTNGSGVASLFVWPPINDIPSCGTLVVVSSPCGGFRMLSAVPIHTEPPGYKTDITIVAVERVNSDMVADFL